MFVVKSAKEDGIENENDFVVSDSKSMDTTSSARLKSFIERIEKLESEKSDLSQDIKDIYGEAKGIGFDVKTIRKIIKLRKMDSEKRSEEQMMLETYANAIQLSLI